MNIQSVRLRKALQILALLHIGPCMGSEQIGIVDVGRKIYEEGILQDGSLLTAKQGRETILKGQDAACVNCHRHSGLGSLEGETIIPPITSRFLFADQDRPIAVVDPRSPRGIVAAHAAYDNKTLLKAINEGVNYKSKPLNEVMPHYQLKSSDYEALSSYLHQLGAKDSPGAQEDGVHIAIVLTPNVNGDLAVAVERMANTITTARNYNDAPHPGQMRSPFRRLQKKPHPWVLDIWKLEGSESTWSEQLNALQAKQPVFTVLGAYGFDDTRLVQTFCDSNKVPCILSRTSGETPKQWNYTLGFTQGPELEARVLTHFVKEHSNRKVIQIVGQKASMKSASEVMTASLKNSVSGAIETHAFDPKDPLSAAKNLGKNDILVLWLSATELGEFSKKMAKTHPGEIYVSGTEVGADLKFLPKSLKAHVVYPFEISERRNSSLNVFDSWLNSYNVPIVDPTIQRELFFNFLLMTEISTQMLDNLQVDYLMERIEDMVSQGVNPTFYPRLSLGPGQRVMSKGAYLVKADTKGKISPTSDWIIP